MQICTRCSVAIHCLIFMCESERVGSAEDGVRVTSALLSESTGTNAVSIRNALGALKRAGIVEVARGAGGAKLIRSPEDLTLLEIFQAVEPTKIEDAIGIHECEDRACPVAQNIRGVLEDAYRPALDAMTEAMRGVTLADMLADYRARIGVE